MHWYVLPSPGMTGNGDMRSFTSSWMSRTGIAEAVGGSSYGAGCTYAGQHSGEHETDSPEHAPAHR